MKVILHLLLMLCASSIYSQTTSSTEYFRHLRYNHISPYLNIAGIHPIDQSTAESTSHYVFEYDSSGRLVEIINNHYHSGGEHPLASIGVYRLVINYVEGKEVRIFFDPNGKRISNAREVYKEVYSYGSNHFKSKLQFYDLNDEVMESNWAISNYEWSQKEDLVIERRFNIKNEPVNISPYFEFGVTGILVDKEGIGQGHFNLNEQLEVADNSIGIASYKDSYDTLGNHIKFSYHSADDSLTLNPWQFAFGENSYDSLGNNIFSETFDIKGALIRSNPVPTNVNIQLSAEATNQDSAEIKSQSLGYLKALQQLDTALMDKVMNDSLNKVTIGYNRDINKEIARATTRGQMIAYAEDWNKSNTKFPPFPNDQVTILSIYNRIASVKLVSDNWVEYLHLIKLNGKWDIINLIWQQKDVNYYPK